jgi:hypothetical protein
MRSIAVEVGEEDLEPLQPEDCIGAGISQP